MGPSTRDRIALALSVAIALCNVTETLAAPNRKDSPKKTPSSEPVESNPPSLFTAQEGMAHMVGLRLDIGRANALGAGYIHAHWFDIGWFGYGADVTLRGTDFGGVDAVSTSAVVRMVAGHSPPIAVEYALGGASYDDDLLIIGRAGAFISFLYADIGYVYSHPFGGDRPAWLSSHQFALRVHIPVHRYNRRNSSTAEAPDRSVETPSP